MISENVFIKIYRGNYDIRNGLKKIIDEVVKTVDYTKKRRYTINPENNSVYYYTNNGNWEWSWVNSINTNYSCLYLIIKHIDLKYERNIGEMDFDSDFRSETLNYIESKIKEDKQTIFTPGSDVFRDMFFAAQKSWNWGLISEISSILTLKKHYDIGDVDINFKRGDLKDMNQGTDLQILFEGSFKNTQHKSTKLSDEINKYTSKGFRYNELTYRNNVDLITIDCDNVIYLFRNSKNPELCGERNSVFYISKELEIKKMNKEKIELTNLLTEINRICFEKRYIFTFEKGESGENYFTDETNDGIREINFFLNDINDENLVNIVRDQISKL